MAVRSFIERYLAWDIEQDFGIADWLCTPSQKLRSLTSGAIYHDEVGEITDLRRRLDWYPQDVWLYLLAAGWQRIGEEEHLMPRAGYVDDELGSALIGARLVRDIMALCFLMERQYAPYPKWFGSAFQQLACAKELNPSLRRAQLVDNWQSRGAALAEAYQYLATMHNKLGITDPLTEGVSNFHSRPFKVIHGERFAQAITEQINDPHVQSIAQRSLIGSIDQFSDNTKLIADITWQPVLRQLYAR